MIRYVQGHEGRDGEWVPGMWRVHAGVICAVVTTLVGASAVAVAASTDSAAAEVLSAAAGCAAFTLGLFASVHALAEDVWVPIMSPLRAWQDMKDLELRAYIKYLERKNSE